MAEQFQVFQRFNTLEIAEEITQRIRDKGIECIIVEDKKYFDPTFANNQIEPAISIKLNPGDFTLAHAALEEYYSHTLENIDDEYYLLNFTNDELTDIIQKPDEWGHFDYILAKKLLKDRGIEISSESANLLRKKRNEELAKPEISETFWIYAGYISAILGGFLGLIIGWTLKYHKKTLPDGNRVYSYGPNDRIHGRRIIQISAVAITFWTIIKLIGVFK